VSNLFELEQYKKPVSGNALAYMTGRLWTVTRRLFHNGYIVGAIRSEAVAGEFKDSASALWFSIDHYREYDLNNDFCHQREDTLSDDRNTYHGLITRRGIEALYRNGRITFSQGIDVWEERERARALWAVEHPDEYLVVCKPDDSTGLPNGIHPPEVRWTAERAL
jgi:hypothetical protein